MSMIVVAPVIVTEAMITATDIAEDDYAAWASGTTYADGNRCISTTTHRIYESLQGANTNHDPTTDDGTWWVEVSATNRYRCFDLSTSTQTAPVSPATTLYYEIAPGSACTAIALFNLTGAKNVRVRVTDPDFGALYDVTTALDTFPEYAEWYQWFFGQRTELSQFMARDLPSYPNATIRVDFEGGAIGVLMIGQEHAIGDALFGARLGIRDYSRKETDAWGNTTLVQRAYSKVRAFPVAIDNTDLDRIDALLSNLRATPCLWSASTDYSALTVFGWVSNFEILVGYPTTSDCSLDIEGLA